MIFKHLRQNQHVIVSAFVFLFLLLSAGIVFASSGGADTAKHWVKEDTYKVMNFTVLVVGLFFSYQKACCGIFKYTD
jgi:hypothetical protein